MKKLFISVICFSAVLTLLGNHVAFPLSVDSRTAEQAAETILNAQSLLEQRESQRREGDYFEDRIIKEITELIHPETESLLAYVFHLLPQGYVIVSPDTGISPIIAYSFDCNFPRENLFSNPLFDLVQWDMKNRLDALPFISDELKEENERLWNLYLLDRYPFVDKLSKAAVYGPYLSTSWNQDAPYNNYCPYDSVNNVLCKVGCVATAMAQIINYHKYPSSVSFTSADSYTSLGGYGTPSIWINAPGAGITAIVYPAGNDTAARLSYACGVSVKMQYTWWWSSAQADSAANALTGKWGYNSAQYLVNTGDQLYPYLRSNMINRYPAMVCICQTGKPYFHEIVCDGYDQATGKYHLNFGQGGDVAWYTMPTEMPQGFDAVHSGIVNIVPGSGPSPTPPPSSDYRILAGGDYNGDGRSDIAIFRAATGLWCVRGITRCYFGRSGDIPVPGNYQGGGKTEMAIFRPLSGLWAYRTDLGAIGRLYYGRVGDMPIPADYNGNGITDVAIFRPSSGLWSINGVGRYYFGTAGDLPVPGIYAQGGGKPADIGIFRPSSGLWAFLNGLRLYFGQAGDIPVPGDYDGDGDDVAAIYRPSTGLWSYYNPSGLQRIYYGGASDTAVPADYNGDGKDDLAVFRQTSGLWAIRKISRLYFGAAGDIPVTK